MKVWQIILFTSFIPLLSNCGNHRKPAGSDILSFSEPLVEGEIPKEQVNIALRICYAYKSKTQVLNNTYNNKKFTFNLYHKDCDKKETSRDINATIISDRETRALKYSPIEYVADNEFLKTIQTDQFGYLSSLCSKVLKGERVLNSTTTNNTLVQVSFSRSNLDQYRIVYYGITSAKTYQIQAMDFFTVRTQFDYQEDKIIGNDEEILQQKVCSNDPKKIEEFGQKFKIAK